MIKYLLISKSKHWPPRMKKINMAIKKILSYKSDLKFNNKINYNCNLVLVDDHYIKKINNKFRKKNKSTDVLTFVSEIVIRKSNKIKICDIFLSAQTIKNDAKKNNVSFYDHLTHLIIHSFLHINGFMHQTIGDFNEMKKKEIKILNKLGISNPYL